jgi:hypothetical protein
VTKRCVISPGKPTTCTATISHIFFGTGLRQISEKHGFWVYLAGWLHNQSNDGVHGKNGRELDLMLKQHAQRKYEETHSREEFMKLIGRNYL